MKMAVIYFHFAENLHIVLLLFESNIVFLTGFFTEMLQETRKTLLWSIWPLATAASPHSIRKR